MAFSLTQRVELVFSFRSTPNDALSAALGCRFSLRVWRDGPRCFAALSMTVVLGLPATLRQGERIPAMVSLIASPSKSVFSKKY